MLAYGRVCAVAPGAVGTGLATACGSPRWLLVGATRLVRAAAPAAVGTALDATALSKAPHVPGLARPLCLYVRTPEWRDGPKATTEMNGADADDDDGKCTYVRTYG